MAADEKSISLEKLENRNKLEEKIKQMDIDDLDERIKQWFKAGLAKKAKRYEEMVDCMKIIARMDIELTREERNFLCMGYKSVIGARRSAWKILQEIYEKEAEMREYLYNLRLIKDYIKNIEDEITKICNELLSIVAIHLLPSSTSSESSVFFYKMKGDYYRYMAEIKTGDDQNEDADQSLKAYQAATSTAMIDLLPTNLVRLELALNFSVLYYDILNSPQRACQLAEQAYHDAIADLSTLDEFTEEEVKIILSLLKDNLDMWNFEMRKEGGDDTNEASTSMEVEVS